MFVFRVLAIAATVLFGAVSAAPVADIAPVDTVAAAPSRLLDRATPVAHAAIAAVNGATSNSDGKLFVCTDSNFRGSCSNFPFNVGHCLNFYFEFQDSISSLGPDQGFDCELFTDANCGGRSFFTSFPGVTLVQSGFNDQISAFRCFFS